MNILDSNKVGKKLLIEGSNHCEDFEWEDICETIQQLMGKTEEWYVEVKNFGWRSVDGFATIQAKNAGRLLQRILPDTDCSFKIYRYGKNGIAINNAHHDSPMWAEWYYAVPVTNRIRTILSIHGV